MPRGKAVRPSKACDAGARLKLHRRLVWAAGRKYTVIGLRPGAHVRFSTNLFHDTWHVLSDLHGARVLGRLLWGLSFQRRPDTLVVIGREHLVSNPFDAEPATPIALMPADLTYLSGKAARLLRRRLTASGRVDGTVRWQTWGLDRAVTWWRTGRADGSWWRRWHPEPDGRAAEVGMAGGMLVFRGAPTLLRDWAVAVATLGDYLDDGMDYVEIDHPRRGRCRCDGEVQVFTDFRQRVRVAGVSRREVLAGLDPAHASPAEVRPLVWAHNANVHARRHGTRSG